MIYEPDLVKGFPEFLPPESQKFEAIRQIVEEQCMRYGFLPIKTPSVEFDELARAEKIGTEDEAVSDRFRLQDKGGRNLSLRHEFTYQLGRIFKQHQDLKLPFRRYQIGSVFRDEPTMTGRYREFTQCDADIIGDNSIEADAECLALANDCMKTLGIEAEIHVNNRRLMHAILESVHIEQKETVMRELDKLDKLGEDTVKTNLKKYADANQILTLFKLLEKDLAFFMKNLFDGGEELFKLKDMGKSYGYTIKFNPFLVRGLSYYTGNVFELRVKGSKQSLGGGGRYAKVAGKFINRELPSVGISLGIERLMEHAKIVPKKVKAIVISIDQPGVAIALTQRLRKEGVYTLVSMEKVGKALEYANAYDIPFAIFVGKEEIKKKKYTVKDLISGDEKEMAESMLIKRLR